MHLGAFLTIWSHMNFTRDERLCLGCVWGSPALRALEQSISPIGPAQRDPSCKPGVKRSGVMQRDGLAHG